MDFRVTVDLISNEDENRADGELFCRVTHGTFAGDIELARGKETLAFPVADRDAYVVFTLFANDSGESEQLGECAYYRAAGRWMSGPDVEDLGDDPDGWRTMIVRERYLVRFRVLAPAVERVQRCAASAAA